MSVKAVIYFPLSFVVWLVAIAFIIPEPSIPRTFVSVILAAISAFLLDKFIANKLKALSVISFYIFSVLGFFVLPFQFSSHNTSFWSWLGGYHILQGKSSDFYIQYQYNSGLSILLFVAVSIFFGIACSYTFTKIISNSKRKLKA